MCSQEEKTIASLVTAISVGDLIKHLQRMPQELKIGVTDSFGGFMPMTGFNFSIKYDSSQGWDRRKSQWVEVNAPYDDLGHDD